MGQCTYAWNVNELIRLRVHDETHFNGMLASIPDERFLFATDAILHSPGLHGIDDLRCALERAHLHGIAYGLVHGNDAVDLRLDAEIPPNPPWK